MKRGLTAALAALLLAGCSSEPDVDWGRYPTGVRVKIDIDKLENAEDCSALQGRLANAEESDLTDYIQHAMDDAGC